MNYKITDLNQKALIYGSIITQEKNDNQKTCICSFSWNSEAEAEKHLQSKEVVVMACRPVDEEPSQILQLAWVIVGKDYYKTLCDMPKDVDELDIQFNCVILTGNDYEK